MWFSSGAAQACDRPKLLRYLRLGGLIVCLPLSLSGAGIGMTRAGVAQRQLPLKAGDQGANGTNMGDCYVYVTLCI